VTGTGTCVGRGVSSKMLLSIASKSNSILFLLPSWIVFLVEHTDHEPFDCRLDGQENDPDQCDKRVP
jgi:hypothetical protein